MIVMNQAQRENDMLFFTVSTPQSVLMPLLPSLHFYALPAFTTLVSRSQVLEIPRVIGGGFRCHAACLRRYPLRHAIDNCVSCFFNPLMMLTTA